MASERGAAASARFAILGLLLSQAAHGYDLARQFSRSTALGDIMRLGPSHLYALLTHLERDGLISGEDQDAGARPQRRVYSLTQSGKEAVLKWVSEPVRHPRDMRIEFPLKLYLARHIDEHLANRLTELQRRVFKEYMEQLENQHPSAETEEDAVFMDLMRSGRIGRAEAALKWLDISSRLPDYSSNG